MRHQRIAKKFGRKPAHRKALLTSLVTNLVLQSSIKTTLPKAKQARKDAEKLVTLARKGTLAARRLAASRLQVPEAVQKLFDNVVPAMAGRNGGYTRILKLGQRRSDGSEMCLLQWVSASEAVEAAPAEVAKA
jgi:large subunit ribosomal protein L17